jgi:hypothetical protein
MSGLAKLVASALSIPLGFAKEVGEHLNTIEKAEAPPKEAKPVKMVVDPEEEAMINARRASKAARQQNK